MIIVPKIMKIFENSGGYHPIYTHIDLQVLDRFNKFIDLLVDLYVNCSMLNDTVEDEYYSESIDETSNLSFTTREM